jgi:outer membrane protein TolC
MLRIVFVSSDARSEPAPRSMTLEQVVSEALANHPTVRASQADEAAASARVDEARTKQLPDLGVAAQINRSTGNTVPGAFFPEQGFPPVAGAPRGRTFDEGVWQTGGSLYATWDVLSLARQAAAIDAALAGESETAAITSAQRLEVAYRAADTFLLVLEAQEALHSARASVDRAEILATVTKTLVAQSLRPGADAARAEAEFAAAQTQLAKAEQSLDVRRAQLAEAIGDAGQRFEAAPGALLEPVSTPAVSRTTPSPTHPQIVQSEAAIARTNEARRAVDLEYLPRLDLAAAIWMRGSGLYGSPASGLVPDVPNWAAGLTATWSFLNIPAIRARARAASANQAAAIAHRDQTTLAIAGQLGSATAILRGAQRISAQTPTTLASARAAEQQATARYRTGLASVVDVAETQRLLAQAEIDDAVARIEVRRALLLLARASGDLSAFFGQTRAGRAN